MYKRQHPGSNLKVGVHSTKSNGIKTSTDKCGVYMRMGYVYVVVIAAAAPVSYTHLDVYKRQAKVDKDGYETSFRYGKDGQVEEICYADVRTVSVTYNAIRQLEEVKDWRGTTRIAVDEAGRVSSVTDPDGKTVG